MPHRGLTEWLHINKPLKCVLGQVWGDWQEMFTCREWGRPPWESKVSLLHWADGKRPAFQLLPQNTGVSPFPSASEKPPTGYTRVATVITPALVHTGGPRYKGQDDVTKARPGTPCAPVTHVCESKAWVAQGHSTSQIFTNKDSEIQPNVAPHSEILSCGLTSTQLEEQALLHYSILARTWKVHHNLLLSTGSTPSF